MKKAMVMFAVVSAIAIIGCISIEPISVEKMKLQLVSTNTTEVIRAKASICSIVSEGFDTTGWQFFNMKERMEFLKIIDDDELLLSILCKAEEDEIVCAVIEKMRLDSSDLAFKICKSKKREKLLSNEKLRDKVVMCWSESELTQALSLDLNDEVKDCIRARQIDVSNDANVLIGILEQYNYFVRGLGKEKTLLERLTMIAKDEDTLCRLLNGYLKDESQRKSALQKLPTQQAVAYVLNEVERFNNSQWIRGNSEALVDALNVATFVKDDENLSKILIAVCTKRAECGEFGWQRTECANVEDPVVKKLKDVNPVSSAVIKAVFSANDEAWKYLIDAVESDLAYEMLTNGVSRTEEIELELLKRVDKGKLDMAVYTGVRFENAKNIVIAEFTPEMRAKVIEMAREAYNRIVKKSQEQAATTFALEGFYLGMPFSDVKVVLAQHFPQIKIHETTDGDDADLVIYLVGQESPFCYADAKEKKVYQFNFGKQLLKKWYEFDVQNYSEWALSYAAKTGDGLRFKMLTKDVVVEDPFSNDKYRLFYYQDTYQYKNNRKGYRITYFGEMKDFTGETGLNALIVKEKALKRLRYVRGDEGSMRVRIEID